MLVLTKSDIQAIEDFDKLKTLVEQMRSTAALALRVGAMAQEELIARSHEAEASAKRSRQEMETLATKFKSTVPTKYIKFNVRGTPFSTATSNMLKSAEKTYFSVLAEGQFKIEVDPADGAIFIDRSVRGFQFIWDYLMGDLVSLDTMSELEREIVREEADFYQVHSLLKLLAPPSPKFSTEFDGPQVFFSSNNTVVLRVAETDADGADASYVISSTPFEIPDNADFAEMKIKLVSAAGRFVLTFGLAPAKLLSDDDLFIDNCGYHCASNLYLYGESIETDDGVKFNDGRIYQNSILQLRLHRNKTVSIVVDGEDLGVAFRDVNTAEPLYLVVQLACAGDCVELLPELV
jgi:hypothetical protein